MRAVSLLLPISLVVITLMSGCRTRDFQTEGDVLRARIVEMEREILQLERRNAELRGQLQRMSRAAEVDEEIAAEVPQIAELAVSRFSHARDTTGDGMPDQLRLYLQPMDGRGRFVQVSGELSLKALIVPRDPNLDPLPIGAMTLGPGQLRDAYRSGFMGTHYTVRMPLEIPQALVSALAPDDVTRVLVRAVLTDGLTGLTHHADRTLDLRE